MDILGSLGLSFGRSAQYAVFMLRLHHIYRHTTYKYPVWLLISIVVIGFCGTFSVPTLVFVHSFGPEGLKPIVNVTEYGCEVVWRDEWIYGFGTFIVS